VLDNFEIRKSGLANHDICIVKVGGVYVVASIFGFDESKASVLFEGEGYVISTEGIHHIYHNGILLEPNKKDYEYIIEMKQLNQVDFAKKAYKNMAKLRNLSSIEKSEGVAKLIKPIDINNKSLGYLIARSAKIAGTDYEKATEVFKEGLKEIGLAIVNS
jgi:hypothetical protein